MLIVYVMYVRGVFIRISIFSYDIILFMTTHFSAKHFIDLFIISVRINIKCTTEIILE
jgi:hypothetical protein